jgi:hypothetical protein
LEAILACYATDRADFGQKRGGQDRQKQVGGMMWLRQTGLRAGNVDDKVEKRGLVEVAVSISSSMDQHQHQR